MALVAVASAKGSPGATTAALALAALWPRDVLLVEADPAGGDVALRMPAPSGLPLDPDRGLVSLAAAGRNGLTPGLLHDHAQTVSGGLDVVAGVRGPEQAPGLESFWGPLAAAAADLPGVDVVADLGRLDARPAALPLVRTASVLLLVCRPAAPSVVHARERLAALAPLASRADGTRPLVGVVLVADARAQRDVAAAVDALRRGPAPPDRVWQLALDPRGAEVFDGREVRRPERTDLVRSAAALAGDLAALVAVPADAPGPPATGHPEQAHEVDPHEVDPHEVDPHEVDLRERELPEAAPGVRGGFR